MQSYKLQFEASGGEEKRPFIAEVSDLRNTIVANRSLCLDIKSMLACVPCDPPDLSELVLALSEREDSALHVLAELCGEWTGHVDFNRCIRIIVDPDALLMNADEKERASGMRTLRRLQELTREDGLIQIADLSESQNAK